MLVLGTNHARLGCIPEPETPKEWDAGMWSVNLPS